MRIRVNNAIKYICLILELFLLFIIQSTPNLMLPIFGATPYLVIPAVISIAMLEDDIKSTIIGAVGGLLVDLSFGEHIGLFAIIMALTACVTSLITGTKIRITFKYIFVLGAITMFVCTVADWYFRYVNQGYTAILAVFVDNYLPIYLYSLLVLPVIYLLNLGIYKGLRVAE